LSVILWLAYCTQGLVIVVMFVIVAVSISTIGFVTFIVGTFGCVTFVSFVADFVVIIVAVINVLVIVVGFIVAAFGGRCGLLVILWLA